MRSLKSGLMVIEESSESYVTTWLLLLHKNVFGGKCETLVLFFAPNKDMTGK